MANNVYPGRIINMTANGLEPICNVDATLNMTSETTTDTPCKPTSDEAYKSANWTTVTQTSKSWTITGSMKAVGDTVTAGKYKHSYLANQFIEGLPVEVTFGTTQTTDFDFDELEVYSGSGIVTDVTWNAPSDGESTVDFTVTGNGELTHTITPVTT